MRAAPTLLVLIAALAAGGQVCAEPLRMPDERLANYDAYSAPQIAEPWIGQRAVPVMREQPVGELIATRLGLVEGSAELFRYRVENAPSDATMFDGVVDGGGIKLKLTW